MNGKKIGTYLQTLRREYNITQEQLGEQLGVTNKTVSRWETGVYMPPIENLKQLSEIYNISINELLAGCRLSDEEFRKTAEENLSSAYDDIQSREKNVTAKLFLFFFSLGLITVLCIIAFILVTKLSEYSSLGWDELNSLVNPITYILGFMWFICCLSITISIITITKNRH